MPRAERKASLRAAHSRTCPNVNQSALSSVGSGSKCSCKPRFYTFHRGPDGRAVKGERVLNRQVADRALRALQVKLDEGGADVRRPDARSVREWCATFVDEIGPGRGVKGSTLRAYASTITIVNDAFGDTAVRSVGPAELRRLVALVRAGGSGDATVSKHLRHFGAIMQAAEDEGLIARNPVPRFKKGLRLKITKGTEAFTDIELAKLWAAIEKRERQPVYLAICKAAVTTGARQGELIGADLDDLSLLEHKLEIRHHFDDVDGLTLPKDGEPRTVHLIPPAARILEEWLAVRGIEPGPLFPAPRGVRVNGGYLTRLIVNAMAAAGIPKEAANGRARKPFHAFRASYARLCLEQGRAGQWVQAELGHSTPELTIGTYGAWSEEAKAAEAQRVGVDAFPV